MRHACRAAALVLALLLTGCGGAADEQPSQQPAPEPSEVASGPIQAPSPVETMNEEQAWDNWGDGLPAPGDVDGVVQLVRLTFTSADDIRAHLRIAIPEQMIQSDEVTFCEEGDVPGDMVGFGSNWQAKRSDAPGYHVCDTTAQFTLEQWGDEEWAPQPTLEDGVWRVNLGEVLAPEDTVGLYRMRLEFGGEVVNASDGGQIDGKSVTWRSAAPVTAEAKQG